MAVAAPGDLVGAGSARELMHRLEATVGSWSGERRSGASLVVGANTSGGRAPIVWVCRSKHEFDLLAEALGPDQPFNAKARKPKREDTAVRHEIRTFVLHLFCNSKIASL